MVWANGQPAEQRCNGHRLVAQPQAWWERARCLLYGAGGLGGEGGGAGGGQTKDVTAGLWQCKQLVENLHHTHDHECCAGAKNGYEPANSHRNASVDAERLQVASAQPNTFFAGSTT